MLKKDLIDKIAAVGLTKKQAGEALEAVLRQSPILLRVVNQYC